MTLRDLLIECNYKSVFNNIYKKFYQQKNYTSAEIIEFDLAYSKVVHELISLPKNPKENLKIYLTSLGSASLDIDVCFFNEVEDELFSFDFVSWKDIIDMEIFNTAKMTQSETLAYILWEITFWGFSEEEIQKEGQKIIGRKK